MTEAGAGTRDVLPASRVLLVGIGNPLRGDDAVGRVVVESLPFACREPVCRVLSLHQLTPEVAEELSRAACAVFIDAAAGVVPGSIHAVPVAPLRRTTGFTHHYDAPGLLHLAQALFGRVPGACWLITVGAGDFACREGLTPAVAAAVPAVHALIRDLLDALPELAEAPPNPSGS